MTKKKKKKITYTIISHSLSKWCYCCLCCWTLLLLLLLLLHVVVLSLQRILILLNLNLQSSFRKSPTTYTEFTLKINKRTIGLYDVLNHLSHNTMFMPNVRAWFLLPLPRAFSFLVFNVFFFFFFDDFLFYLFFFLCFLVVLHIYILLFFNFRCVCPVSNASEFFQRKQACGQLPITWTFEIFWRKILGASKLRTTRLTCFRHMSVESRIFRRVYNVSNKSTVSDDFKVF